MALDLLKAYAGVSRRHTERDRSFRVGIKTPLADDRRNIPGNLTGHANQSANLDRAATAQA
jgi:hypothetical protein